MTGREKRRPLGAPHRLRVAITQQLHFNHALLAVTFGSLHFDCQMHLCVAESFQLFV